MSRDEILSWLHDWFNNKIHVDNLSDLNVRVIYFPFKVLGEELHFYVIPHPDKNSYILSDGGQVVNALQNSAELNLKVLQNLLKTYGVSLMEDLSVMEITDDPVEERILNYIQSIIALDGILRTWNHIGEEGLE